MGACKGLHGVLSAKGISAHCWLCALRVWRGQARSARRQCHETTIHAVDALAAALGRPPNAKQVPISDELALDGIDELLVGFWQRGRNSPHTQTHERTLVSAGRRGWLLHSSPEAMRTARFAIKDSDTAYEVDAVISGDPVDVYLAVWNRGGDVIDSARRLATWKSTILW